MGHLKERMSADLLRYGLRLGTRKQYMHCAESYARHFGRSPATLGSAEIEAWIRHLARSEKRPVSFRHQALMALKFLYFVTLDRPGVAACFLSPGKPGPVPDPLMKSEMDRLLEGVASELHKTVLIVAFGGGLRLGETCRLRTGDIDGKRMLIRLASSNSAWPQFIPLHSETLTTLRRWWRIARPQGDLLFPPRSSDEPLRPGPVQTAIRQAAIDGGFDYTTIEQTLRYSFFTQRLASATHPREVRHILRCTSIRPVPTSFITRKKATSFHACEAVKGGRI